MKHRHRLAAALLPLLATACAIVPMAPDGETPSTPSSTTTVPPGNWRCPNVIGAAMAAGGWTLEDMPTLDALAYRESRCIPHATSSTGDYGALQINWRTWRAMLCADPHIAPLMRGCDPKALYDIDVNVRAAFLVRQVQGWRAWATYRR